MKASTHTEVYRPFDGKLRRHPMRFLPVTLAGIRVAFKRKLPALLLYVPTGIGAIVAAFVVHLRFTAESGQVAGIDAGTAKALAASAGQLLDVSNQIIRFLLTTRHFALLAVAWYGAGLFAEDRRLGAHLLYFSRPISRLDYFLGKLGTVMFYGACASLFPALLICSVATFSSPGWSFLTEEGDVIPKTVAFALLWISVLSLLVLAISSMVDRKTLALAGFMGFFMLTEALGNVAARIVDDARWQVLSLTRDFEHVADWLFNRPMHGDFGVGLSLAAIGLLMLTCLGLIGYRLRRMEVVA